MDSEMISDKSLEFQPVRDQQLEWNEKFAAIFTKKFTKELENQGFKIIRLPKSDTNSEPGGLMFMYFGGVFVGVLVTYLAFLFGVL